ncbi:Phosphoribosylformylglycinamidine synthase [Polystyrenella longa]|uniref:Phosphoribosylformylglycinamidine synthase n=1 Tax=Polystyrenella longa TaxID=2528007 RepID=A0A518CRH8_9PLAN|nr:phosphoribosylformylglycinamidine synthase I [Polystyrenella longa]QDU81832.1 Phosphoribosylformylglycinamidine synthase [Polystyrenella longa]
MADPRVCVLRAPGTNCDLETAHAFELAGGTADRHHINQLLANPHLLEEYQVLCIPGGFSYGDDIGAGVIFSRQLRNQLGDAIHKFLEGDKLVLGICNGFQVLLKSGILPGGSTTWPPAEESEPDATLTWNLNGRYTALWTRLKVASSNNVFLRDIDTIEMPIAHAEGRLVVRDESLLQQWSDQQQIALQYTGEADQPVSHDVLAYPQNPNGSTANIAGLSDPSGRVLGLMPHPERFLFATQHPQWTRLRLEGEGAGMKLFHNAISYFA